MVKIFKCYLIPKKGYDILSKGAIFFGQPYILTEIVIFLQMCCVDFFYESGFKSR